MGWHDLALAIGVALVVVGLAIVARSLRPMRFDASTGTLTVAGRRYTLHRRSGTIVNSVKRGNRLVDEHGLVIANPDAAAPEDGSLSLVDRDGASHVLRFRTWRLEVGAGDTVGAIWAIPDGQRSGGYIAYRNATRDETRVSRRLLGGMMRVRRSGLLVLVAGTAVVALTLEWRWRWPLVVTVALLFGALALQRMRVHHFVREELPALIAAIDRDAANKI